MLRLSALAHREAQILFCYHAISRLPSLNKALLLEIKNACFQTVSLWILKQTLVLIPEAQPWLFPPGSIHPSPEIIKIPVATDRKTQGNQEQLGVTRNKNRLV